MGDKVDLIQFVAFVCYQCGRTYDDDVTYCTNCHAVHVAPIIFQIDPAKFPDLLNISGLFAWAGPKDPEVPGNGPGQRRYVEITGLAPGNQEAGKSVESLGRWHWEYEVRENTRNQYFKELMAFAKANIREDRPEEDDELCPNCRHANASHYDLYESGDGCDECVNEICGDDACNLCGHAMDDHDWDKRCNLGCNCCS